MRKIKYWVQKNSTVFIDYSNWYVGITNHPHIRKSQHSINIEGNPYFWQEYIARTREIAEAIEKSFHDRGMKEKRHAGGARSDNKYVYVYKKYPTIFD